MGYRSACNVFRSEFFADFDDGRVNRHSRDEQLHFYYYPLRVILILKGEKI
jgi:hypothetical protein